LRLQEILYFRAAGLPLSDIAAMLADDSQRLARLEAHQLWLAAQVDGLKVMQDTLQQTIDCLKRNITMPANDLYAPFPAETQAAHESWLIGRGVIDHAGITRSQQAVQAEPGGLPAMVAALRAVEHRLADAMDGASAGDAAHHGLLEDHRALMTRFWGAPCGPDAYRGLAALYVAQGGFADHFEGVRPGLARWLNSAMFSHADRLLHL
jgi:DNA-binding transcriptional MerR regulator